MTARNAYRCAICHSWAFSDTPTPTLRAGWETRLPCPYCEAKDGLRLIGRVEGPRITSEHYEVACDERCTSARGNKCACPCLGVNHGKDALIVVTRDEGGTRVALANAERASRQLPKIRAEVAEYKAARDALMAELERIFPELDEHRRGEHVRSWYRFRLAEGIYKSIRRASAMHSHRGRMGALAQVAKTVAYEAARA